MFVRIKTRPNTDKKSVQLVKSVRNGKQVRQKVIRTIGYAFDAETLERLKNLAEHLKVEMQEEQQLSLFPTDKLVKENIQTRQRREVKRNKNIFTVNLENIQEKERFTVGIHEAYGKVYDLLGFNTLLTKRYKAAENMLYHLTMARLAKPLSKRGSVAMLTESYGVSLNLDKVYRMMDKIDDKVINKMQNLVCNMTHDLLKERAKVVFYDCTTLYFESFTEDELKKNGYSKDGKFNQPQVLLALLITEEGLPIGYEVFPGSTFEGHTLAPILDKIKLRYNLSQVVFVADSGLLSEENREYLASRGYEYVLGARLKNLPKVIQNSVTDKENYTLTNREEGKRIAEFSYKGVRLITNYGIKRATKDKHNRNEGIEKLQKRLQKNKNPKSLLSNYGYKKYLRIAGESKLEISPEKIKMDEKWDGLRGVITNVKDLGGEEILAHYANLWQIESCFRIQKHNLKIRPVFHWTPNRIHAHIAMCFMAFTCHQYLSYRLRLAEAPLSIEKIRGALLSVQMSVLKDTTKQNYHYGLPSKVSPVAEKIYKTLGLKMRKTAFIIER